MLHKVNEDLKKFSHINKKAMEQYNSFTKQRETLNRRKSELDTSAEAIEDLIHHLDMRKDEAIQRTFKQVAKHFSEVWNKLVPDGKGSLIMLRKVERVMNCSLTNHRTKKQTKKNQRILLKIIQG
jgi:structural maintenance of chromosome 3 (chondroitin sulfate proteoglycan 6)